MKYMPQALLEVSLDDSWRNIAISLIVGAAALSRGQ